MSESDARIGRVMRGLLPETAVRRQFGEPAVLAERMVHHQTPGVSVAVIHNGRLEWARGFGVKEWGAPDPVTEETLFQAGSISKPVFALAVMRLVQTGKLDLDADVNDYLTTWRIPANGDGQSRVTLRQLLGHTAGLTVEGFPGYLASTQLPSMVQILDGKPPANSPPIRSTRLRLTTSAMLWCWIG